MLFVISDRSRRPSDPRGDNGRVHQHCIAKGGEAARFDGKWWGLRSIVLPVQHVMGFGLPYWVVSRRWCSREGRNGHVGVDIFNPVRYRECANTVLLRWLDCWRAKTKEGEEADAGYERDLLGKCVIEGDSGPDELKNRHNHQALQQLQSCCHRTQLHALPLDRNKASVAVVFEVIKLQRSTSDRP